MDGSVFKAICQSTETMHACKYNRGFDHVGLETVLMLVDVRPKY
jgi:hypothetical protein